MRPWIEFILNGQPQRLEHVDPTQTVLRYLREQKGLAGTKEGCAEGDCGACTAVIADLHEGAVRYRAVNTCIQFVGMLDGKALITIEGVKGDDVLHPVQRAMIENDGSQCGFCTPGFVMSLYAGYRQGIGTSRRDIDDLLAGNLCRCTGYRSIAAAAEAAFGSRPSGNAEADDADLKEGLSTLVGRPGAHVESDGRHFIAPATADELADVVERFPDATLAGATDVGLFVTKQGRRLDVVVHLANVRELNEIEEDANGVRFGAGVTYDAAQPILERLYPDIGELIRRIGGRQVRAVGTIGGNIGTGSPIGDMPPALIAVGATMVLRRGAERRTILLEDYFIEYGRQDRRSGEFIESIFVPAPRPHSEFRCYKLSKRFDQDISAVCGAFGMTFADEGGTRVARDVRIAFGGMAGTPIRARDCEIFLEGRPWSQETIDSAVEILDRCYTPITDWRASAEYPTRTITETLMNAADLDASVNQIRYRRRAAANLLRKCFLETSGPQRFRLAGTREMADHGR